MNWTAQVRAVVTISVTSDARRLSLSPDDFEFLVDEMTDALELSGEAGDITIGASLAEGWFEASFSVDAGDLVGAQDKAMRLMAVAQETAARRLDQRLARAFVEAHLPRMVASQVTELVPA